MNNRRRMTVSATACSRRRNTRAQPSFADGRYRRFCFRGIMLLSPPGGKSRRANAPKRIGRTCWKTSRILPPQINTDEHRCRKSVSICVYLWLRNLSENNAGVDATEAERIAHHVIQLRFAPMVRHDIEVAGRIGIFVIDGRRNPLLLERE